MKRKILYVDPQEAEARKLIAALKELEPDWEFVHASNGLPALACVGDSAFDAVIADTDLPDSSGVTLLDQVMATRPKAVRFAISAMRDTNLLLRCLGTAHQYLVRPCEADTLRAALRRAFALELWLPREKVVKLLSVSSQIPSPPKLYFQALRALRSENANVGDVGNIISMDPAMTAKILQAVNSPLFGLGSTVVNPSEAVFHLGAKTTLSLMLVAHSYSYFDSSRNVGLNMADLWRHSLAVGRLAWHIAQRQGCLPTVCDEASTAGMLHDIGKLVLAVNHSAQYREAAKLVLSGARYWWEAEQDVFDVHHAEVGASLAVIWGLPATVVEAIAMHHQPDQVISDQFSPLAAVHVANAINHIERSNERHAPVNEVFLERLGLADKMPEWRAIGRDMFSGSS